MAVDKVSQPLHNGKGSNIKKQGHTQNGQFGSGYSRKSTNNPSKDIAPTA